MPCWKKRWSAGSISMIWRRRSQSRNDAAFPHPRVRCGKERLIPKNVLTKTGTVVNIIENRTHSVFCAQTVLAQGGRTVLNAADSECPLYEREEDDEKSGIFTACG